MAVLSEHCMLLASAKGPIPNVAAHVAGRGGTTSALVRRNERAPLLSERDDSGQPWREPVSTGRPTSAPDIEFEE